MRRDEVVHLLAAHREELAAMGVESLALFGSVARDEAGPESDVDVLLEHGRPIDLFDLSDIKRFLEGILGRRVDLVTRRGLKRQLREQILAEAVRVA